MAAKQYEEITILECASTKNLSGKRHTRLIDALYNMIMQKDIKTAIHCKNVAEYSVRLGKKLGLNTVQLQLLRDGARLHDIGKIMVDISALNKRSKLNDRELLQVRSHPKEGMKLLTSFRVAEEITDIAWHHHERWDGKGYPDGMKGEEIPYLVRIVCICDAIDAMASNRPYRHKMEKDNILKQLKDGSGTQFDPEMTEVAIEMIENGKIGLYG